MFASSRRIETFIAWPWKVKVKIWPQVKVTAWPKLHISRSVLTRQTHWDHFHVSSSSQSQVTAKTCWWPRWPQTTLAGSLVNTWPWVIMSGLIAHDPERITPYWCVGKDFNFSPLTHNGEVRILTWPQVIDISKIRDIQNVGTSGLIMFWKLEKILLRTVAVARAYTFLEVRSRDSTWWPDLMWPRHKNFTTDVKLINEKVCQVSLRCSLSFSSYPRKTTGGGQNDPPPTRAKVKWIRALPTGKTAPLTRRRATIVPKRASLKRGLLSSEWRRLKRSTASLKWTTASLI